MSEKIKFGIGDHFLYLLDSEIRCEKVTSLSISDDGIMLFGETPGFMWERNVHLATRCNVDMLAQELIDNIKKDAREIKEKYCEEFKPLYCCDCGLPQCGCKR